MINYIENKIENRRLQERSLKVGPVGMREIASMRIFCFKLCSILLTC